MMYRVEKHEWSESRCMEKLKGKMDMCSRGPDGIEEIYTVSTDGSI
jgi:hypothetical protein